MFRPTPHVPREDEEAEIASPEFSKALAVAFGVAALAGMVTGILWIAWTLCRLHVWP